MVNFIKKINIKSIFLYLILFLFMFIVGLLMPLGGDDWNNYLNGKEGFLFIIEVAKSSYLSFEGRFFSRIFDSLLVPHQVIWSLINAFMFSFVYYALLKIIKPKNKTLIKPLLLSALLFIDFEAFAQVYIWKTGNITYFFPFFFAIFLIFYKRKSFDLFVKDKWYMFLILPLLAFFFSMFVETMTVGIIMICLLFIIFALRQKKLDSLMLMCLISSVIGLILMITSPGSVSRLNENDIFSNYSLVSKLIYNIPNLINYTFIKNSFLVLLLIISLILMIRKTKLKKYKKNIIYILITFIPLITIITYLFTYILGADIRIVHRLLNAENWYVQVYWISFTILFLILFFRNYKDTKMIFFLILGLAGNGSMMLSPIWGGRTAFLSSIMLSILCILIIDREIKDVKKVPLLLWCINILFITLFLIYSIYYRLEVNNRDDYIKYQLKNNEEKIEVIILPRYYVWNTNPWGDGHHAKCFKIAHNIDKEITLVNKKNIKNKKFRR